MHPIELIEFIIVGGFLFVILLIAFFFEERWKKIIKRLAIVFFVSFCFFYFLRPYWVDMQIEKRLDYLQVYLEEQYPGETWEYWTVPYREDGYEHMNPYHIGVTFDSEPEVEYEYFVRNKENIKQTSYSIQTELQSDLLHLEEK